MKQENTIVNKVNEDKAVSSNEIADIDFIAEVDAENKLAKHAIQVHKFGGSSLATPKCIKRALEIIRENCQLNDIVVVSANGKTTDRLFALYSLVERTIAEDTIQKSDELTQAIDELAKEQAQLITELLNANNTKQLLLRLHKDIEQLTTWLTADIVQHHNDVLALGEVWSARLLSALLNEQVCPSNSIDSRDFLVIDNEQSCVVDTALSAAQLRQRRQFGKLAVITGYISKDSRGKSCTLGRNGSDYSATIIASLVAAGNVTLWTDVDGIYSADPRVVPSARKLHRLPNGVAKELGRLGNPVLHAKTLLPLINPLSEHHTHLHVASSFDAQVIGTEIGKFGQIAKQELSVTYLNDLLLAQSVSFIGEAATRAKAEFSPICIDDQKGFMVITQGQQKALSDWLASHDVEITFKPVAIIATVGHRVAERGDIRARFKRSLKAAKPLNLVGSDNNHSVIAILPEPCSIELLNTVHHEMTKDARHIGLVVAGMGNIGERFLELLPAQLNKVYALENLHLVGLLSSKKALINNDGIDVNQATSLFAQEAQSYDHEQLISWLTQNPYDELIVVDITPSEDFSLLYEQMFALGVHVIGANKWAASSSTAHYNNLVNTADSHNSLWLGNTTVGAGLPINYAIDDLRQSGDSISELSGIFSGTLSWLFETYDGSSKFSELLLNALAQGITEPDPREDLSGRDVKRKLLILARKAGFELALDDIDCQNLVPEALQALSTSEFLARANELDEYFATALSEANRKGACIRYVARFQHNPETGISAKVSLEVLPQSDAFANLTPCDNIFQISSHWYQDNPLIIRGPGAGRDVTAGGLHSDLVKICQQLAHKQSQVKIKGIN
ncbi:bifunctional aspartate kinase/homoserine dehydrogenase II [Colwellia sp. Bg11-28]|uniref:bifunctional aspartate kinase/homoserine dehydrogenase II n=1 Tax=Colwellia sp. Bg11-28 TaxID=2058305 RepID=UPI000C337DB7|nr:bifunctional aspartate kinase/homoserine dehydrogenase II [Colwellia sp. Bg11-28]PKH88934.1 bifunctional aspartate kinase/homoserine dehydrogenase II [Colwellia sp. Bg11-28]